MKKARLFFLAGILLSVFCPVKAENLTINPFVKGSFAEIKEQRKDQPFILVFWSESCSYCMKELALFGQLQKQFPAVELVTVATDPFLEDETVKTVLARSRLEVDQTWVFAEQFPERIYADIDKRWRGELPVTHFFGRDNREVRHMGVIKEDELVEWLAVQSAQ